MSGASGSSKQNSREYLNFISFALDLDNHAFSFHKEEAASEIGASGLQIHALHGPQCRFAQLDVLPLPESSLALVLGVYIPKYLIFF